MGQVIRWVVLAALGMLLGCKSTQTVQCELDAHCDRESGGRCLVNVGSEHQWCGYPDTTCPTGMRWSELDVGDSVSGRCVEARVLDKVAPAVIGRAPAPDSQGVAPTTFVTVTFSEPIDPESVTAESVRLVDQMGNAVEAARVTSGAEVVLTPKPALDPRLGYRVTVSPEVTDVAGNGLPEAVSWAFRTRDASWSSAMPVEQEQAKKATLVAAGAGGGVVVTVWAYHDCATFDCAVPDEVWAAVRTGGVWAAPVLLGTVVDPPTQSLLVGVSPKGRAIVAWSQGGRMSDGRLFVATYDGGRWIHGAQLARDRARYYVPSEVVFDPSDTAYFMYSDYGEVSFNSSWVISHSPVAGWGMPAETNSFRRAQTMFSAMAYGKTPIAFGSNRTTAESQLVIRRYSAGTWQVPEPLGLYSTNVAITALGAYGDETTALWAIDHVYARRVVNGNWEPVVQLDGAAAPRPSTSYGENLHNLVYTRNGTSLALWATATDVWYSARPPGQAWNQALIIDADGGPAEQARMTLGGRRVLASWRTGDFFFNEYSEAEGWRGANIVETQSTPVIGSTVVYDESTNTFVALWLQPNAFGIPDVLTATYR